jgi:WD40 repeat protein
MSALNCVIEMNQPVASVDFSPHAWGDDNQLCLAMCQPTRIALWTQAALRKAEGCSHTLLGHQGWISSLAFSSNRQLLASGSRDSTVRLWDTHTNECVAVLEGHTNWVNSVAFSPDGRLLASASADRTVRLWDVVGRKAASPVDVLQGHTDYVWSVSFSSDGRQLASGSFDSTVRLWSVPEGVPGPVLQHDEHVFCVAFSPVVGSNMLVSGCSKGVFMWDVSGTKQQVLRELKGHKHYVTSVVFSPDGSQFVSGSGDRTVRLWSVASGKLLKVLTGHERIIRCVAFHPNGKQVVSCSEDNTARIWTVCEWSDLTHRLFGKEMKGLVFCLMCIEEKESLNDKSIVPKLPMALWLQIFQCLYV